MKTRTQFYFKDFILIFRGLAKSVYLYSRRIGFNLKCQKFYFPEFFSRNGKVDFSEWNRFRLFSPDDVFNYVLVESPENREILLDFTALSNYSYIFFSVRKEGNIDFSLLLFDYNDRVIYEKKDKYSPDEEVLVSRSDLDDTIFELRQGRVRGGMEQTALTYVGVSTLILNLVNVFLHPELYIWHCEKCKESGSWITNTLQGFNGDIGTVMKELLKAYKLAF